MEKEERWLRETYVDLLIEYAKKDDRLVLVEADLSRAAGTLRFAEAFPDRIVNVGIAEANMIGVASGMNAMGKIPFTHTFTPFATRRCCDQVTLSVAYAGLNVKMAGSDPGVTAELNGGTHMSMEDISIMRNIPGMTIFEPVDSVQLKKMFPQIFELETPVYIRLLRKNAVAVFDDSCEFTLGKGTVIREGQDVVIFCSGIEVAESLKAAQTLEEMGIFAEVVNIHTIKPLDEALVYECAKKTGAVVTAENHSVTGGLGSAICEYLGGSLPVPVQRVGVRERFGQVGPLDFLMENYGLTEKYIVAAAKKAVAMK